MPFLHPSCPLPGNRIQWPRCNNPSSASGGVVSIAQVGKVDLRDHTLRLQHGGQRTFHSVFSQSNSRDRATGLSARNTGCSRRGCTGDIQRPGSTGHSRGTRPAWTGPEVVSCLASCLDGVRKSSHHNRRRSGFFHPLGADDGAGPHHRPPRRRL